ncbi:hypothetical protein [Sulfuracidifex metallicus]|uniref:hypothetical protein n=1 Tax=Sulfuracidifex metallicus TaxID=47303 RepID=UPI00227353DF|nr:hypothetical protein [Sulfuracidifex metallicus]MCY0849139.1 hypothetical protein [Sulfuracidifex metallicus]
MKIGNFSLSKVKKGISVAVFMIIMIIVVIGVLVPAYLIMNSVPSFYNESHGSGAIQVQGYQKQEVLHGIPFIYYNSTPGDPSLMVSFPSKPVTLNFTQVYYYNSSLDNWEVILNETLITHNEVIGLPCYVYNEPLLLVTNEGNLFLLNPNESVVASNVGSINGKYQVYILSEGIEGNSVIPLSVEVQFNGKLGQTPLGFNVTTGTYQLTDCDRQATSQGLTGNFKEWSVIGDGGVSSTTSLSTNVKVNGALVIIALYQLQTTTYTVEIKESGLNLTEVNAYGGEMFPLNKTVPITLDGKVYQLGPSGLQLTLTYGYHSLIVDNQYTLYFDYNSSALENVLPNGIPDGVIDTFVQTGVKTTGGVQTSNGGIFVTSDGTYCIDFTNKTPQFAILTKNDFSSIVNFRHNSTPYLGDIAGQLIQASSNGITYDLGPSENYGYQEIYLSGGSTLTINIVYLFSMSGKFTTQNGQHYNCLLSNPTRVYIIVSNQVDNSYNVPISSPVFMLDKQEWRYGGSSPIGSPV